MLRVTGVSILLCWAIVILQVVGVPQTSNQACLGYPNNWLLYHVLVHFCNEQKRGTLLTCSEPLHPCLAHC